jgi:anti-anti-sigma factor
MPDPAAKPIVRTRLEGHTLVLSLHVAEVYQAETIERLGQELRQGIDGTPQATRFVLDLSAVAFLTSAALGLIINLNAHLVSRGYRLAVAGSTGEVAEVFKHSRLGGIMPIVPTVAEALEMFRCD